MAIDKEERELNAGGPEILSVMEVAELAFRCQEKEAKITLLPDGLRKLALVICSKLPERIGGPAEFFLTVSDEDTIAPAFGDITLEAYFKGMYKSS